MNAARYQQIEQLFHAALEQKPDERPTFIKQACGSDEALRLEVESLLRFDDRAANFISTPPAQVAAAILDQNETESLLGCMLGHYRIVSRLGAGGMGEVYLAQDTKLGRNVAVKLLPPESVADERSKKRLIREAQAAAKLDHPNICPIHEVNEQDGYTFIVMQYVEGEALSNKIQKGPLELTEALEVAAQVADALCEAHSRGITHRDIKPQNIMITPRGQARVLDFGLATIAQEQTAIAAEAETKTQVTEPGLIVGTVPYMSPEQVKGEATDARSDIFSFGALLHEMISGKQPFTAANSAETISAILNEEPPPLNQYASNVPEELERITRKCLEKNVERRYQSTSDLLTDLRSLQRNIESGDVTVSRAVSKRRHQFRGAYLVVSLIVLGLGAIGVYFLYGQRQETSNGIRSLAILPFDNSGDPNSEQFSDGITESLINSFSRLSQLKVIARTTAFRYKGKDTDAQAIGRDLRVDAIVTGRVTQQGDRLIVQAELLSTVDGSQVWGARYTRKLSDVFAVEEQIASEISKKLQFKLTGEDRQLLSKRYTQNLSAYQNYSLGWSYLHRRTRQDLLTAIAYFEKAILEEPNYALAHAALAEAYLSLTIRGYFEPAEGRRKTEEAARKALSLDPNLAEAHVAIGETHVFSAPFDFAAGDRELRRAIELSPSLAYAYQVLGASLLEQGRLDEALELWPKAREIDPLSPIIARLEAVNYFLKRDFSRALELLRQSYELGPTLIMWSEIEIYIHNNRLDEAIAELEKAKLERSDDSFLVYGDGMIAAALGKRAEAFETIRKLERVSGASLHRAMWIAMICSALRDNELALSWLERGLEAGAITIFYKDDPVWDAIRSDQRFVDLLRRMRITQ